MSNRFTRVRLGLFGLLITVVPLLGWVGMASAQSFRTGTTTTVGAGETVNSALYASGNTVDIAGIINGDVFCAGQNVTVSGTVNGDVLCAGQTVRVTGRVTGDIRVAGQSVSVGAKVGGSVSAVGQTVTLDGDAAVRSDIGMAGQNITLNGPVDRDVAIGATNATINSRVGRDVHGAVDKLTLGSGSDVGGSVTYTSNNDAVRDPGSKVAGSVTRNEPKQTTGTKPGFSYGSSLLFLLWLFVSLLLMALVLVLLFPRAFQTSANTIMRHPGWVLLTGLIASIVWPVMVVVLLVTLVGIPLALLALAVWFVLVILAGPVAAYTLGHLMLRKTTDNAIWKMLAGAAVLLIIYFIPLVGWLVALFAFWFGLGAILWQAMRLPKPRYHMPAGKAGVVDVDAKRNVEESADVSKNRPNR